MKRANYGELRLHLINNSGTYSLSAEEESALNKLLLDSNIVSTHKLNKDIILEFDDTNDFHHVIKSYSIDNDASGIRFCDITLADGSELDVTFVRFAIDVDIPSLPVFTSIFADLVVYNIGG